MRLVLMLAIPLCLLVVLPGCDEPAGKGPGKTPEPAAKEAPKVAVRVFDAEGELVGPLEMPAVRRTPEEWQRHLEPEAYRILRRAGTERPFCGTLLDNKRQGVYTCAGCDLPLFSSDSKFTSGTGWPSFFQPIAKENIEERADKSHGMTRVEILCARCEGHLGHVFRDGPKPTGLRYCLNSVSLQFTDSAKVKMLADPFAVTAKKPKAAEKKQAEAVFAGGCFWCVEAVFEELDGVVDAVSGYAGGSADTATYGMVSKGGTKHAEAVKIVYDPSKITYAELLEVHFATHDPTTLNRQGADVGPHYRSAIFYANEEEKRAATAYIAKLQKGLASKIVTTLEPLQGFYEAEPYHQDFVAGNPDHGYVRGVALPKVEKVRTKYKDKLKQQPADAK